VKSEKNLIGSGGRDQADSGGDEKWRKGGSQRRRVGAWCHDGALFKLLKGKQERNEKGWLRGGIGERRDCFGKRDGRWEE